MNVSLRQQLNHIDLGLKHYVQQLQFLAFHDPLTKLPNRFLFKDRLTGAIKHSKRSNQTFGLLFIDLDKFKSVNDNYDHRIGDKLLRQAADRITATLRESDTAARFGGDEFVVIVEDLSGDKAAAKIAAVILKKLRQPFDLEGQSISISGSIGIAIFPKHGWSSEQLIKNADMALYQAKALGGNNYQIYGSESRR